MTLTSIGTAVENEEIVPEEVLHKSARDPIEVDLAAGPLLAVGVPFDLEVTLTATWADLPGARVLLTLPPGVDAEGPMSATVDLVHEAPATLVFSLRATKAGTHPIGVAASARFLDIGNVGGDREGFLVLPEIGLGAFHEDLVPRTERRTLSAPAIATPPLPAPTTSASEERSLPPKPAIPPVIPPDPEGQGSIEGMSAADGGSSGVGVMSHASFQVRACWFYESEAATPVDTPQRFTTIQVWDEDDFSDDLLAEGVTGDDGCFTSGGISREDEDGGAGNQDVFIRIHLCNAWVCTQDSNEDFYVYRVDHGEIDDRDLLDMGAFKAPAGNDMLGSRAFHYANNAVFFAANQLAAPGFTASGPQVTLWAPSQDGNCPGMFLRRSENRIHVCGGSDRQPDDVGHEVGHWVHWNLYGQSFWPSPGGPHNLCTDSQHRGLAWAEGWANWYGPRANMEVIAPSADNNDNYDRPWDGTGFSIDMDTNSCSGAGDDNEMRVAHTLWDIRDDVVDGVDTGSTTNAFLSATVAACDNNNFREFFDAGCSFVSQGGSGCTFMRAAWQNNVDFDDNNPTVAVTSQGAFAWVRGTITINADASDPDPGCTPSVEFRVSDNNNCTDADWLVGTDTTSAYSRTFNTATIPDDPDAWTCARASDALQLSPWDASASAIGIDNTPPNVGISVAGTLGNAGWYRSFPTVTIGCTDNLSGVDEVTFSLDGGPVTTYTGPFVVVGQGVHGLSYDCSDHAGNADGSFDVIKVDTLDPTTSPSWAGPAGENGWYVGDVTVTMACADPTPGSGCANTQIAHTHPDGTVDVFDYGGAFVLTGEGVHRIDHHSVDVAGNVEATAGFDVAIDTMPPEGEIVTVTDGIFSYTGAFAEGGLFTNEPTLTVTYHATDGASGLQFVSVFGGEVDAYAGELDVTGTLTLALPTGISSWTFFAEDMAGHTAQIGTLTVAYVPSDTFPSVTPRPSGWWKTHNAYSDAQVSAMLPLINTGSHAFGTPDAIYDAIADANYDLYLQSSPPSLNERVRKELAAAWLNLASEREPTATMVTLSGSGWSSVVQNTGGSPDTLALNVILEVEKRLTESPDAAMLGEIRALLTSFNTGALNS